MKRSESDFYNLGWEAAEWGYTEEIGKPSYMTDEQRGEYSRGYRDSKIYSVLGGLSLAVALFISFVLLAVFVVK